MTALAAKRNTPEKASSFAMTHQSGAAASASIFIGALVLVDAAGFIDEGTATASLIAAGVCVGGADGSTDNVDNSAGANGDVDVVYRSGIFFFANDGATPVVQADLGADCFILDDQTVSGDGTARSTAGKVYQVDGAGGLYGAGVWVAIQYPQSV